MKELLKKLKYISRKDSLFRGLGQRHQSYKSSRPLPFINNYLDFHKKVFDFITNRDEKTKFGLKTIFKKPNRK